MEKKNTLVLYKVLYALIIFLGAFLTFMFQPVTGKILTPQYGGAADIWASCLVFFQFVLFAGYCLAYFLNKLKPKTCAIVYSILFMLALVLFKLPVEFGSWLINAQWAGQNPLVSLFLSLFKYAFLPVLVLSTISVSMQNWYTKQTGESPYILYSISNIGSFLALFLYPLLYEPIMATSSIINLWHCAFALLVLLIISASIIYFKNSNDKKDETKDDSKISYKKFLYWIILSAFGTIILTSYTTFATVRILPMPMFWTLFLGLYLLTFVLCFGSEKFYNKKVIFILTPIFLFLNLLTSNLSSNVEQAPVFSLIIFILIYFTFLTVCNGEIYKTRPNPSRLSEFYLSIALGGVLGGIFVNIIAPLIFSDYFELPIINVIMCAFIVYLFIKDDIAKKVLDKKAWTKIILTVIVTAFFAFIYYIVFVKSNNLVTKSKRNFYGTAYITIRKEFNIKSVANGYTIHGVQFYDAKKNEYKQTPLAYYADASAVAYAIIGMKDYQTIKDRPLNIGAIGLGTGTVASYTTKNDKITFYEIDPKMYDIAQDEFTYLKEAKGKVDVQMGDARIVLSKNVPQKSDKKFDILLIDAFTSDAVPVHLITKEAFDIYKKHIKDDGIILFHISNRYLAIEKTLKKTFDEEKLRSVYFVSDYLPSIEQAKKGYYKFNSSYFVVFMPKNKLYNNFKDFNMTVKDKNESITAKAFDVSNDECLKPFTDDYSSLVRIFKFWYY